MIDAGRGKKGATTALNKKIWTRLSSILLLIPHRNPPKPSVGNVV
jgi:hypothetical protein